MGAADVQASDHRLVADTSRGLRAADGEALSGEIARMKRDRHTAASAFPIRSIAPVKLNNEVSLQCRSKRIVIQSPDEPPCPAPGKAAKQTLPSLGGFALPPTGDAASWHYSVLRVLTPYGLHFEFRS